MNGIKGIAKLLGKIFSFIYNLIGLVLAIWAIIDDYPTLEWAIVLCLIIFNSIFLMVVSAIEAWQAHKTKVCSQSSDSKIKQLDMYKSNLREYYNYIITTFGKFSNRLLRINLKKQEAYADCEKLIDLGIGRDSAQIKERLKSADNAFVESMISEHRHFLGNITSKLKSILDYSLASKGCQLEVSIAIKQLNRIIDPESSDSNAKVITVFRDYKTYSQGKREVAQTEYTISGNTDFHYCVTNPYFLKNNISPDDKTYANENPACFSNYNCTIVVPIKCSYSEANQMFGYLACDTLNEDFSKTDIMDTEMAEIMIATANIIALYFEDIGFQFEAVGNMDFMDTIYKTIRKKHLYHVN